MSNYIVEYVNKDIFITMSISDFRITFKENEEEIMMFRGDERIRIVLDKFICIKNNNSVVLYTKKELKKRVPRKSIFGNLVKKIMNKHKKAKNE